MTESIPVNEAVHPHSGTYNEREWVEEAIHEYLIRLVDDCGGSVPVSLSDDRVIAATTGPPDERDIQSLLTLLEDLRPALAMLAALLDRSVPDASSSRSIRIGRLPDAITHQQSLPAAAGD